MRVGHKLMDAPGEKPRQNRSGCGFALDAGVAWMQAGLARAPSTAVTHCDLRRAGHCDLSAHVILSISATMHATRASSG